MFFNQRKKLLHPVKFHDFWEIDGNQIATSYRKLSERIEQLTPLKLPDPAFNWWKIATIAASVALLIVSVLYGFKPTHPVQQPIEVVFVSDRATQLTLSDGTNVWLSAHSQLQYQQNFTGKTRDVALEGEAYFEVAHNNGQPFRVLAGGQTVVALGTSFNVRAYTKEPSVKVALIEGSVRVTDDKSGQRVILEPAQEAIIEKKAGSIRINNQYNQAPASDPVQNEATDKKTGSIAVNDANLDMLMSWKTGRYIFNNTKFEDIAETLEKGFKVTIHIENEALKSKPYTMRFVNGESLERILELIQVNAKYSFQYHNGIVVIK